MNVFVSINTPKHEMSKGMLLSSLSFIHPMTILKSDDESIDIKLFDVNTVEKLNDKLDYLCEASSVDFSYRYKFIN